MRRTIHTSVWVAIGFIVSALLLGGITGSVLSSPTLLTTFAIAPDTHTPLVLEQGFASVVQKSAPAVVNISSSRIIRAQASEQNEFGDEFFRRFFGPDFLRQFRVPKERRERSLGSGVIVNSSGYILTNHHVIEDAMEVMVSLSDKRELLGRVIGSDPGTDIAVLKIDADKLSTLPFADSSKVQVGDVALAIGNPFGLGRTVTMGIVSATGRGGLGIEDYEDFIQTDASINPGNSGGALTNVHGDLIGVNTAILSPTGGSLGIGFAVPSNMVRKVMDEIVRTGKVTRGFMGVVLQDVTPDIATAMKLGATRGALVSEVKPDTPAARAGIEAGDVITEANGNPIADRRSLQLVIGSLPPSAPLTLRMQRNGAMRVVTLTLTEIPKEEQTAAVPQSAGPLEDTQRVGMTVADLTSQIRRHLHIPSEVKGVVVADVEEGTAASLAGVKTGDVIQEVNRKSVENAAAFKTELASHSSDVLLLRVSRQGNSQFVAIR
jgi:serine protease Do